MTNRSKIYLLIIIVLLISVPKGLQLAAQHDIFSFLSIPAQYIIAIFAVLIGGASGILYLIKQSKG